MMKLKFTFLGLFFFVFFQANDFFKSIQSKPVYNASSLVIFYRPDCPYCMKLDEEIERNANLSKEIKTKFNVSVIDISTPEGRRIATFYGVDKVPTIVKYDKKNENFENIVGFQKSDILMDILFSKIVPQNLTKNLNAASICGNGMVESGEACDDGNSMNGDGCSNTCTVQSGWICSGSPSICTPSAVCGNGMVESGEACDDGNSMNGDGCSNTCTVQSGWVCSGSPSICTPSAVCGNGIVENGEACDDGNSMNGDGCSNTCTVQSGWNCTGSPSVCSNTLSIEDVSQEGVFNLSVAPNPVTDRLHVQFFLSKKSNVEITVLDISGKQVFQTKSTNLIIGSNDLEIPVKNKLTPGIYILKMKFTNDKVITKKIIVK